MDTQRGLLWRPGPTNFRLHRFFPSFFPLNMFGCVPKDNLAVIVLNSMDWLWFRSPLLAWVMFRHTVIGPLSFRAKFAIDPSSLMFFRRKNNPHLPDISLNFDWSLEYGYSLSRCFLRCSQIHFAPYASIDMWNLIWFCRNSTIHHFSLIKCLSMPFV